MVLENIYSTVSKGLSTIIFNTNFLFDDVYITVSIQKGSSPP